MGTFNKKTRDQIKSPFLRLCLFFYGSLSIQLRPVNASKQSSLLNLFWNAFLAILIYYILFLRSHSAVDEEVKRDPRLEKVFHEKPLFAITFKVGLSFIFQFKYLFTVTYYLLVNITCKRKLIYLLDAFRVKHLDSLSTSWKLFALIAFIQQTIFILVNFTHIPFSKLMHLRKWFQFIAQYLMKFVLSFHSDLPFLLTIFYKYATVHSLAHMKRSIMLNTTATSIEVVEKRIRKLATLNASLGHLLSLPLMISVFDYAFVVLLTLSCYFIHPVHWLNYSYLLVLIFYHLLIATLQSQIDAQLLEMSTSLEQATERRLFIKSAGNLIGKGQSEESVIIKCRALRQLYLKYFQLTVFKLFKLDLRYFVAIALFVANYIVLLSGTI